jgi:hypothetical protein
LNSDIFFKNPAQAGFLLCEIISDLSRRLSDAPKFPTSFSGCPSEAVALASRIHGPPGNDSPNFGCMQSLTDQWQLRILKNNISI